MSTNARRRARRPRCTPPHVSAVDDIYTIMQTATANIGNQTDDTDSSYNTSFTYKLAKHLFRLPSRMLGRMRQLDDVLDQPLAPGEIAGSTTSDSHAARVQQRMRETGLPPLPGPWGFLTSGYFIGLFFMVCTSCDGHLVSLIVSRLSF